MNYQYTEKRYWVLSMIKEELKSKGKYAKRDALNFKEMEYLKLLFLKWMFEQGMLQ